MDVVIASVHTRFDQSREEMTARVLRAIENPYVRILGHPTGRLLLRREPFALDLGAVLRRAAELGVAVEHNAAPERLDLSDRDLRLAKELGCKIVINSPTPTMPATWEKWTMESANCVAPGLARPTCSILSVELRTRCVRPIRWMVVPYFCVGGIHFHGSIFRVTPRTRSPFSRLLHHGIPDSLR
jgi:hypothetical protein